MDTGIIKKIKIKKDGQTDGWINGQMDGQIKPPTIAPSTVGVIKCLKSNLLRNKCKKSATTTK